MAETTLREALEPEHDADTNAKALLHELLIKLVDNGVLPLADAGEIVGVYGLEEVK